MASGQVEHVGGAGGALHVVKVPLPEQPDGGTLCCATNALGCVHLDKGSDFWFADNGQQWLVSS